MTTPKAIVLIMLWLCLGGGTTMAAEQNADLSIPGTGDSQHLLRDLAEAFMLAHPGVRIDIPDSIGSSGGIKAVLEGKATLARVANFSPPTGTDADLHHVGFALTPVVFAVHPSVTGVDDLNSEDILGIYSGAITNWSQVGGPPGKIYPIAREEGDSSLKTVIKALPGFHELNPMVGKVFYTTPSALQALAGHAGTIAYGPLAMFSPQDVRVVALNGKRPDMTGQGKDGYPLNIVLGLIWKGEPGHLEQQFLDFVRSPEAARIIHQRACIPLPANG